MAPSIAMSALTAGLKTEELPPRSVLGSRGEMQTSLSPAEETVKPKVAILPFSVEALMADRKPSREVASPDAPSVPGTSHALGKGVRMGSFDVLIKPESPDSNERTSWLQSPRFSPTPPRKFGVSAKINNISIKYL
uniref:Uncharacterized protein n=1 Tax=Sander lucioperca TaxID=283035 RepID=A0A8C9X9T9_SANLU